MNRRQLVAVGGVAAALVAIIVILLVTASGGAETAFDDPAGDVQVDLGSATADVALADILHAELRASEGGVVFFEVRFATAIPERLSDQEFDLRWEVTEDGEKSWLVFANLDFGPNAYVTSEKTNYGSSTIDQTLPGSVLIRGDTLTVRLSTTRLPDFPHIFEWHVETALTGDVIATDRAPDEGAGELEV